MNTAEIRELAAFVAVVERGSFTKAAAHLAVTTSALSQTIRALEERLGVRVLNRTTRAVATSEVGARLYEHVKPALQTLAGVSEIANGFRDRARGNLRITAPRTYATTVLAPVLFAFSRAYPDVVLEIDGNDDFVDIVRDKFDAGIRLGESVARDMTAVKLGGKQRLCVVASPAYVAEHGMPKTPQELKQHRCINWRRPSTRSFYRWELEKNGKELLVDVTGPLIVSDGDILKASAIAGTGIAYLLESMVEPELEDGTLLRLLADWSPTFPGFTLYYPSRKLLPAPLKAFVDFVRDALR
ncbi:MAG: LysR family transcriptional regulator [Myxococcota bacterium]|nr:LysR family transcriptional regulator [Myxococcota bacterium]